jgi:hypothetical protein
MSQSIAADIIIRRSCGQPGTPVVVSYTGTASDSAALTKGATYMVQSSTMCHVSLIATGGSAATAASTPIIAGNVYFFTVNEASKVLSVIRGTPVGGIPESGTLWLTPMVAGIPD